MDIIQKYNLSQKANEHHAQEGSQIFGETLSEYFDRVHGHTSYYEVSIPAIKEFFSEKGEHHTHFTINLKLKLENHFAT
jgi:hypothetical protein